MYATFPDDHAALPSEDSRSRLNGRFIVVRVPVVVDELAVKPHALHAAFLVFHRGRQQFLHLHEAFRVEADRDNLLAAVHPRHDRAQHRNRAGMLQCANHVPPDLLFQRGQRRDELRQARIGLLFRAGGNSVAGS
jgi:protocatechuate 3,4-dioxygenase beta subunit